MKYYTEESEKDTRYRSEYVNTFLAALDRRGKAEREKRLKFIFPDAYCVNPEKYRRRLVKMLGFPLGLSRKIRLAEKVFITTDKNVNIYRMQFILNGGIKFYGIYFEQIKRTDDTPFILSLHGGGGTPELVSSFYLDSANYNHQTRRLTDRGADVFCPQLLLWNSEAYGNAYERLHIDGKLRQLGGSITAAEIFMLQCCTDYFEAKEKINADKIGVAGLSYGGMYAIHLAAVDTRIKACYSCSWFNDEYVHSWADWSYRNSAKTFSAAETAALICPRGLVIAMGNEDNLFDSKLSEKESERLRPYYEKAGCAGNYDFYVFNGEHELDKGDRGIDFLFGFLLKK